MTSQQCYIHLDSPEPGDFFFFLLFWFQHYLEFFCFPKSAENCFCVKQGKFYHEKHERNFEVIGDKKEAPEQRLSQTSLCGAPLTTSSPKARKTVLGGRTLESKCMKSRG